MSHIKNTTKPRLFHVMLDLNLEEDPSLVGLQALTLWQQSHVEVRVKVARGGRLIPLHAPSRCVETSKEPAVLLLLTDVVLVQSWLLAVDQVHQTCVVRVWRQSGRSPLCVPGGTGSIDFSVSEDVELVVDALECVSCNAEAVAEIDLQNGMSVHHLMRFHRWVSYISPSHHRSLRAH